MAENTSLDLDDVGRLNRTQAVREQIIVEMTKGGKLPEDKEDRQFLLSALDGMDRSTFAKARIKADDAANNNQANSTAIVAQLLSKINVRVLDQSHVLDGQAQRVIDVPALPATVSVGQTVVDETHVGVQEMNYDGFMKQFDTGES